MKNSDDFSGNEPYNVNIKSLTPEGFEKFCKELAIKWANKNLIPGTYSIYYRKREPIDICISERQSHKSLPGQIIGENRVSEYEHFIECKFYKNKLDLDDLGRTYIMTLRYRPKSLVIATNVMLTDRAVEFADWLGSQLSDFACSVWNPLDTSDEYSVKNTPKEESKYKSIHIKPFTVERWSLIEEDVFVKSQLASSSIELGPNTFVLNQEKSYSLEGIINGHKASKRIKSINLHIVSTTGNNYDFQVKFRNGVNNRIVVFTSIEGLIRNEYYQLKEAFFVISSTSGQDIIPVKKFPTLIVSVGSIKLPDLRGELSNSLYKKWMQDDSKSLLTLVGEGGIGKTYLCESICRKAKQDGYRVLHSALTLDSQPGFISELVWLLLPRDLRSTIQHYDNETFNEELLKYFFNSYADNQNELECKELRRLLTLKNWDKLNLEVISNAIVRVISSSSQSIILVLSNCHKLSTSCARVLKSLLSSLETNFWAKGRLRIILEYRDTPEDQGSQWLRLFDWIKINLSNRILNRSLQKLNKEELKVSLNKLIISSSNSQVLNLIIHKSGGNPLFIKMLLLSLMEHEILVQKTFSNNIQYSVESLPSFKSFLIELPYNIELLLIRRIDFWHKKFEDKGILSCGFLLGFQAFIGVEVSIQFLSNLLNEKTDTTEIIFLQLQEAGIVSRIQDDRFMFSHEFILEASKKWFSNRDDYERKIIVAIEKCKVSDFTSAFSKGRMEMLILRKSSAIESFNAALQFSDGSFIKMYSTHKEILQVFGIKDIDPNEIDLFLTNLKKTVSIGEYIGTSSEILSFNKVGIKVLKSIEISEREKRPYLRQFFHNMAHSSISSSSILNYIQFASSSLKYCSTEIEFAQFLNRFVKCCSNIGLFEIGRKAASLALQLQQILDENEDIDLESVILGDIYELYMPHSELTSNNIVKQLSACKSSKRQRSHNLHLIAHHHLLNFENEPDLQIWNELEEIISSSEIASMKLSQLSLSAIKDVINKDLDSAIEKFRKGYMDAAWSESIKEELFFGNNLLVLKHLVGEKRGLKSLLKRMFILIEKRGIDNHKGKLISLYNNCELQVNSRFKLEPLKKDYLEIVPSMNELRLTPNQLIQENIINFCEHEKMNDIAINFKSLIKKNYRSKSINPRNSIPYESKGNNSNLYLIA
jgi:GTPase SAR1 family protein